MPEQHHHLPNKNKDIVNMQGPEAYSGGLPHSLYDLTKYCSVLAFACAV